MSPRSNHDLVVHGDIVLPGGEVLRDGWMGVTDGRIEATSDTPLSGHDTLDISGMWVLPGFVDAHVHTRSSVDEGITATTRAAAAGGTTTVIDMPFDKPDRPVNDQARFEAKVRDVNAEAVVDVALYATFPPEGDLGIIADLAKAGAAGFKVSTIEVDPVRFPRIPDGRLYEAFQEIAKTGRPVAAHQENQEIVFSQAEAFRARGDTAPIDHALSRPPVAEAEAAGRLLELAYWTDAPPTHGPRNPSHARSISSSGTEARAFRPRARRVFSTSSSAWTRSASWADGPSATRPSGVRRPWRDFGTGSLPEVSIS